MCYIYSIIAFISCIFASTWCCYGQNYSLGRFDSINEQYWKKGKIKEQVLFNFNALREYEKTNNTEGIISAYINITNTYSYLGKHKEGIKYLERAEDKLNKTKNPLLHAKFYNQYGKSYSLLGLYHQSNKSLNKAIFHLQKIPDQKQKNKNLYFSNIWKWYNFIKLEQEDSVKIIVFRNKKLFPDNPLVYEKIASFHLWKNNIDSAEYYLQKAYQLSKKGTLYDQGVILTSFGDFYLVKNDYKQAIDYYSVALSLYKKMNFKSNERDIYLRISNAYKSLGDTKKSSDFFHTYYLLNHEISTHEKRTVSIMMERSIAEKESEEKNKRQKICFVAIIIMIVSGIFIYFIRKVYLKKQKKKDIIIQEKSLETKQLKKQVNTAFDKVIKLAKTSSPFFLARFKEVYPDFYKKLTSKHPYLTEHDIKFCAYLRLNLTNKEILQYENISLRTIESKKYRLKKKLGLPPETNLNKWILEL